MRRSLRLAAWVAVLVACALAGASGVAKADDAAVRDARALDLFEKSEAAYDSGRFADAIALLRQSYELKKEPVLLYNMGRAHEGLGDLAAAAQSYEAFLRAQPQAPDRGALERRITTLRAQLAEREALKKQALARDRPQVVRSPSAVPWVVAGVGAAGLVTGGVLRILAGNRNDDAIAEPTHAEAERLHAQAESFATGAAVCFIAGGIVLAGGILWGVLDASASTSRSRASSITPLAMFAF